MAILQILIWILSLFAVVMGEGVQMSFDDLDSVLKTELKVIENLEKFIQQSASDTGSGNSKQIQKWVFF